MIPHLAKSCHNAAPLRTSLAATLSFLAIAGARTAAAEATCRGVKLRPA